MELKDINPAIADHLASLGKKKESLSLYPPATDLALRVSALFQKDPDVYTIWNPSQSVLRIFVKGAKKAEAINYLVGRKDYSELAGKFQAVVTHVRENGETEDLPSVSWDESIGGVVQYLKDALKGIGFGYEFNDVYVPITQTTYHFLEIEAMPIAIPNDNFGNPYGFTVVLACDLVNEVFETGGLMVSTYVRKADGEFGNQRGGFGYAFSW